MAGPLLNMSNVRVSCGPANVVTRRRRRNVQELSIEVVVKVTTTVEKALKV